ncbi:putative ATP-dependent helicase DinG [Streptomyces violaceorubidus]
MQDEDAVRKQALASVESVHDVAERITNGSEWDVVWYERLDRFGASLRVAPMSVSGLLREKLFTDRSVVLTSATLKLGGDFNGIGASLGLAPEGTEGDDGSQWKGVDVGLSPSTTASRASTSPNTWPAPPGTATAATCSTSSPS